MKRKKPLRDLKIIEPCRVDVRQFKSRLYSPACQECLEEYQANVRLALGHPSIVPWTAYTIAQWLGVGRNPAAMEFFANNASIEQRNNGMVFAGREMNELCRRCGPYVHGMFEGMLKSTCVQAWTCIEVLLEELLVRVRAAHPTPFRNLPQTGNVFRRLESAQKEYHRVFGGDAVIDDCISNKNLAPLAQIRHILVHRRGVADQKYIDWMNANKTAAKPLKKFKAANTGDPLIFDGENVRFILNHSFAHGYKLCRNVDRWIKMNA